MIRPEKLRATVYSAIVTGFLTLLIVVGSRNLEHFDAPLVAYTFATLFAMFGITYRYAMWLQRPPTWMYFKRGWQIFLNPHKLVSNVTLWLRHVTSDFLLNLFIWRRSRAGTTAGESVQAATSAAVRGGRSGVPGAGGPPS